MTDRQGEQWWARALSSERLAGDLLSLAGGYLDSMPAGRRGALLVEAARRLHWPVDRNDRGPDRPHAGMTVIELEVRGYTRLQIAGALDAMANNIRSVSPTMRVLVLAEAAHRLPSPVALGGDLLIEARGWVLDTFGEEYASDSDTVDTLEPARLARIIDRRYDGGAPAFIANSRLAAEDDA